MNTHKLGSIIPDHAFVGFRDAFHVASAAVVSPTPLEPGESILVEHSVATKSDASHRNAVADPFTRATIPAGSVFWALICPEKTHKLVHQFAIDGEQPKTINAVVTEDGRECAGMGCEVEVYPS